MNVNTLNITIEQLVPSNHLVRKLDASIDFSFIYPINDPLLQSSSLRCSILIKEVTKGIERQALDTFCLQSDLIFFRPFAHIIYCCPDITLTFNVQSSNILNCVSYTVVRNHPTKKN